MCKAIKEGGKRCAAHTRPAYEASTPGTAEWERAAIEFGTTPSGRAEITYGAEQARAAGDAATAERLDRVLHAGGITEWERARDWLSRVTIENPACEDAAHSRYCAAVEMADLSTLARRLEELELGGDAQGDLRAVIEHRVHGPRWTRKVHGNADAREPRPELADLLAGRSVPAGPASSGGAKTLQARPRQASADAIRGLSPTARALQSQMQAGPEVTRADLAAAIAADRAQTSPAPTPDQNFPATEQGKPVPVLGAHAHLLSGAQSVAVSETRQTEQGWEAVLVADFGVGQVRWVASRPSLGAPWRIGGRA